MNDLLPNDTPVWRCWKAAVLAQIPGIVHQGRSVEHVDGDKKLRGKKLRLLNDLYLDAEAGVAAYRAYMER